MLPDILVTGITDLNKYPKVCKRNCKQCIETDILEIPCEKPDLESVNEVKVNICIKGFDIIKTILGPKLVINGVKKIKVIYTADNCEQSLHSSHWEVDFCEFMLLDKLPYDGCMSLIKDIFIGVENVCINSCDKRRLSVCTIFIICPIIKNKYCYNCGECKRSL